MNNELIPLLAGFVTALFTSSGFWLFIQKKTLRSDATTNMLIGLGHDRIVDLGLKYIDRGWVSKDEYENLYRYLYKPYKELGGNGSAKRIMEEVNKLPIKSINLTQILEGRK